MRINVYSQELTSEVNLVEKESNTGVVYSAVQFMLHSSDRLHHPLANVEKVDQLQKVGGLGQIIGKRQTPE